MHQESVHEPPPRDANGRLARSLVLLMATATGLAVASNYYAQPLLPVMRRDLSMSSGLAGLIVTVAQVGYAIGLLLVLPLGDRVERRRLVVVLSVANAAALVALGAAPTAGVLLPAALLVGGLSVLAQLLVPFAASLAGDAERGRVVGLVMSGLLLGILLARTIAGLLAQIGSWRVVYFVAAGLMLVQAAVLKARLPRYREQGQARYLALLASVPRLLWEEPVLRLRSVYGLLGFASFSVLWTSIAFLLADRWHLQPAVIGLFGLIGAAGAAAATGAGHLSDHGHEHATTGATAGLLALSWLPLWLGRGSIVLLVLGILVLDVAAQGLHITNQGAIYRLRPEARSRITSAYMVLYFVGGAAGSAVSATVYAHAGWSGVSLVGEVFSAASVVVWLLSRRASAP